jgi:nitroreductase
MLDLTPDQVLTTTRTVRKRLDFDRPVERSLIEECLEIAFQAPNGSNMNKWYWIVLDDPAVVREAARIYNEGLDAFIETLGGAVGEDYMGATVPGFERIGESTQYLRDHIHRSPALLLPLLEGRTEGANTFYQASQWGSILQAVWSFMLALRVRGLGSAWTTGHLWREREMAALLGVPHERYTQVGLFPIAWTRGTDFRPAYRKPVAEVVGWNRFAG